MSQNKTNTYDLEPHIAEIYDQQENFTDDVILIRNLIGKRKSLRILEPFCGTGRILIPLALDGHELVGFDQAKGMIDLAKKKVKQLPEEVKSRITVYEADVIKEKWPAGFDLVILGGNCFYELATPEEQESCIISAVRSLNTGGYVYIDNDHIEGTLDESWQHPGARKAFPTGVCSDGTNLESFIETIWFDASRRLVRCRRNTLLTFPDGSSIEKEFIQQKHPVSTNEVQTWLDDNDFTVEKLYGGRDASPYQDSSNRAIFWAVKI